MAVASLRRIVQPLIETAITTQPFAQVGWSPMSWFRIVVLPGAAQPVAFSLPASTVLSSNHPQTTLSSKSAATAVSVGPGQVTVVR